MASLFAAKHVCEIVCRAAERAGIKREVTPKALRHSYATHLMDRDVDLAVYREAYGTSEPGGDGRVSARAEGSASTCSQPP